MTAKEQGDHDKVADAHKSLWKIKCAVDLGSVRTMVTVKQLHCMEQVCVCVYVHEMYVCVCIYKYISCMCVYVCIRCVVGLGSVRTMVTVKQLHCMEQVCVCVCVCICI